MHPSSSRPRLGKVLRRFAEFPLYKIGSAFRNGNGTERYDIFILSHHHIITC